MLRNSAQDFLKGKRKTLKSLCFIFVIFTSLIALNNASKKILSQVIENKLNKKLSDLALIQQKTSEIITPEENYLNVIGSGVKKVDTNIVKILIRIESVELLLSNSYANNASNQEKVFKTLNEFGIPSESIVIKNYKVYPSEKKEFNSETKVFIQSIVGYKIENELEIIVSNMKIAGEILDKILIPGRITLVSISLSYSDDLKEKIKEELIRAAAADSMKKGELMAKAMNFEILGIKSVLVDENNFIFDSFKIKNIEYVKFPTNMLMPSFISTSNAYINTVVTFLIKRNKLLF